MEILFICTGNTCRSPIAQALFEQKVRQAGYEKQQFTARSAGIMKIRGIPVSSHTITVLAEYGIEYSCSPQRVTIEAIARADLVLTMTRLHKHILHIIFPRKRSKVFTLKEFVAARDSWDISDPVSGSLSRYRQCAQEIDLSLDLLVKKLF
jgi:protein-tyrosine-phosphatase